jgi:hypothetical protein
VGEENDELGLRRRQRSSGGGCGQDVECAKHEAREDLA